MVDYMSLEEQVDVDFGRARRQAFFGGLKTRFVGGRDRLLSFDEVRRALGADNRFYLGRKVVEVSKIVGSVGRHGEFDPNFMPAKSSLSYKWKRVDGALRRGVELPAVSLYKIGDAYFVVDGNHRVSVSRYQGVEMIDAEVTEFRTRSSSAGLLRVPDLELAVAC
jgi:hypothetical protein